MEQKYTRHEIVLQSHFCVLCYDTFCVVFFYYLPNQNDRISFRVAVQCI